jgi:phosphatidylglycerophosphatase A
MPLLNPEIKNLDLKQPYVWAATWCGCGMINKLPGTAGSVGAIPFALLLVHGGGVYNLLLGLAVVTALGFWAARKFDEARGAHDSQMIVIDEVAGMFIALIPAGFSPILVPLAFLFFRFFDILKPWPVSYFDKKVKGAAGVMGDDLVAGILAAICVYGVSYAGLG